MIKHCFRNKNVSAANCNDSFSGTGQTRLMEENERLEITCNADYNGLRLPVFQCLPTGAFEVVANSTMSGKTMSKFATK
jgi:hypothetical protein